MSAALVTEVEEVPHIERAVDKHEAVPPGDVVGDGVLDETVLISSRMHRLTAIIVLTSATINLTIERPFFNVEE